VTGFPEELRHNEPKRCDLAARRLLGRRERAPSTRRSDYECANVAADNVRVRAIDCRSTRRDNYECANIAADNVLGD
jgi:hypothetical protein